MKKHKYLYLLVLLIAGVISLVIYLGSPKPVMVVVAVAELGPIEETVANTRAGTVKACRRAEMSPAMGGQIATLPIKEGDNAKTGDILLALWNDDLVAEVELARSEASAAKARADSVCVQAENAQRNANRKVEMKNAKAISDELAEQAVATAKSQQADCYAMRTSAKVSNERIGVAEAKLNRTILTAPFDGVIVEVNGEVGEYVTPSPPGIPTLPAVDMIDRSCFYVVAPIDEVDAPAIKVGMEARISLDAFKDRRFPARVKRISDYVLDREKQARTVDVEVAFLNANDIESMLPGYSADAEVIVRTRESVLRIPTEAVIDKKQVYVFNLDDEVLELRDIEIGLSNWDHTEITKGLEKGELVVTSLNRKGIADGVAATIEKAKE